MDELETGGGEAVAESTPVAEESSPQVTSEPEVKTNPAWQPILDALPTSLHEVVMPQLKEWDRGVNQKFQEIHGEYEPYKAYKDFVENQVDPDVLRSALGLYTTAEQNPRAVWEAIGEHYGYNSPEAKAAAEEMIAAETDTYEDPETARIKELENSVKTLADTIENERRQQAEAQVEAEFKQTLSDLSEKYGKFDETFVLTQVAAGQEIEDAVKNYHALVDQIKQEANKPAPKVLGSGSSAVPVERTDVTKMSGAERRSLVTQVLRNAKQD
jgi:hypothetical protein